MAIEEPGGRLERVPPTALDDWVRSGLISAEQADRIRQHEASLAPPAPTAHASLMVEALGYVGGVVILAGTGILVGILWTDLVPAARVALAAAAAVVLVGAGFAIPDRRGGAALRLRSVLWALGTAATAAALMVWYTDVLDRHDEASLLVVFPPTAAVAAILWWLRRTWLQQLALIVPLMMTGVAVGLEISDSDTAPALASWLVAITWSGAAGAGLLTPRRSGVLIGALAAVFAASTVPETLGIVLSLLTAIVVLGVALARRSLPLLAVAAVGLLLSAPRAAIEWLPGRVSAAITLMLVGAMLVAAAVWVARRRDVHAPGG